MPEFKLFMANIQLIEHGLDQVETELGIDLGRSHTARVNDDQTYYPQIEQDLRAEASKMAPHYEVFYSLERTIRRLINEIMKASHGNDWWNVEGKVPVDVKSGTEKRIARERETGMRIRSDDPLDFTNFGELGEIIKVNWDLFGGMLSNRKAVERVLSQLNSLRGPIAHCAMLAEDEIVRLRISVRDWFHLME